MVIVTVGVRLLVVVARVRINDRVSGLVLGLVDYCFPSG